MNDVVIAVVVVVFVVAVRARLAGVGIEVPRASPYAARRTNDDSVHMKDLATRAPSS